MGTSHLSELRGRQQRCSGAAAEREAPGVGILAGAIGPPRRIEASFSPRSLIYIWQYTVQPWSLQVTVLEGRMISYGRVPLQLARNSCEVPVTRNGSNLSELSPLKRVEIPDQNTELPSLLYGWSVASSLLQRLGTSTWNFSSMSVFFGKDRKDRIPILRTSSK